MMRSLFDIIGMIDDIESIFAALYANVIIVLMQKGESYENTRISRKTLGST